MSIVIPRNSTILGMIKTQSMESDDVTIKFPQNWYENNDVTIKLPQNWYENNDLLGFALCCVYPPMLLGDGYDNVSALESTNGRERRLTVLITLGRTCVWVSGDEYLKSVLGSRISVKSWCNLSDDDCSSDQMCVIYYPKDAIKEKFRSNECTHFRASFHCTKGNYFHRMPVRVEECGVHLIYAKCSQCQQHEECQQKLCLKGREINELPLIKFPYELSSLCLRECKNLESLPSTICELKSLTTLSCSGCSRLKSFPEIPPKGLENLRKLHLDGTAIQELPSSIGSLKGL